MIDCQLMGWVMQQVGSSTNVAVAQPSSSSAAPALALPPVAPMKQRASSEAQVVKTRTTPMGRRSLKKIVDAVSDEDEDDVLERDSVPAAPEDDDE